MTDVVDSTQAAAGSVEGGGYHQELKRTLGSFQVFAISFAFISVAVGIFATYDDVLQSSGPVGIWRRSSLMLLSLVPNPRTHDQRLGLAPTWGFK